MRAGFDTHSTKHWHQFIKCGFKNKGIIAKKTRNTLQRLPRPLAVFPPHRFHHTAGLRHLPQGASGVCPVHSGGGAGCMSLGSLLLPSKVTLVTSWPLSSEPCIHQHKLQLNHPTYSCPGQASGLHTIFTFQMGVSLGNLCMLVKNGFHCTLRVSSS